MKASSSSSSRYQFSGIQGPLSACLSWQLEPPCCALCVRASLQAWRRTTEQMGSSGGAGGHFPGVSTSPGSCQVRRQLLERRLNPLSTWDWSRATQVICHQLMGLLDGWGVRRGGLTAGRNRMHTRVFRVTVLRVHVFSATDAALHR